MSNPNSSPTTTCQLQPILLSSSAFTQNAMSRFSQWNFSKAVMTTSIISSWQIGKLGRRGWHFAGKRQEKVPPSCLSCQPTYLVRGVDGCFYLDWPGQRSVQRVWVGHVLVHARDQTVVVSPSVIPARDLLVDEIVVGQRQLPTKIDWKPVEITFMRRNLLEDSNLLLSAFVSLTGSL